MHNLIQWKTYPAIWPQTVTVNGPEIKGYSGGRLISNRNGYGDALHALWFTEVVGNVTMARFGGPTGYATFSDDRIKHNEKSVAGIDVIRKLKPVIYDKEVHSTSETRVESGYIAQEVYNDVPELRHAVCFDKSLRRNFVEEDTDGRCVEDIYGQVTDMDGVVREVPDLCAISYNELLPYHTKAIQELITRLETAESLIRRQGQMIDSLTQKQQLNQST